MRVEITQKEYHKLYQKHKDVLTVGETYTMMDDMEAHFFYGGGTHVMTTWELEGKPLIRSERHNDDWTFYKFDPLTPEVPSDL